MQKVLGNILFVAFLVPLLSAAAVYALVVFGEYSPDKHQIKDIGMLIWVATMIGITVTALVRRRSSTI